MEKTFLIGPPERLNPADRLTLWLEDGDFEPTPERSHQKNPHDAAYLLVGFDTEFKTPDRPVSNEEIKSGEATSLILSYQFYAKTNNGTVWKGICCPEKDERISIEDFLLFVIGMGTRIEGVSKLPKKIYLVGHFTRADIPAFDNFQKMTKYVSAVRNTFVSIDAAYKAELPLIDDTSVNVNVILRDTMLLTPQSNRSLKKIGEMVGIKKVELAENRETYKKMIRNMDRVRSEQWDLFKDYALTDAEICVHYIERVINEYHQVTGKRKVPVTLTGIGIDLLEKHWQENGLDRLKILGKEIVKEKQFNKKDRYFIKRDREVEKPIAFHNKLLAVDAYHGGRNEQYWFGPCFEDDWSDFDLSSAYPTAMALIGMPDWDRLFHTTNIDEFHPTVLGYANIEFEFPSDIRYPTLPVRTANGLIFPLKGQTDCVAPEIYLARKLGAKINILEGFIVPSDDTSRVFAEFIKECIKKRNVFGKNTLQNLFWKEISNSTYGKTAQGLRDRRVYDLRERETKALPESRITNAYFAAFITSFVRATLGEIMNSIPQDKMIFSCTTDGFITNISDEELEDCTKGSLCAIYRDARHLLTGDHTVLERKHYVRNLLGWRTRGQATLKKGIPEDTEEKNIVLAKGGLWIRPEFEETEEQNDEVLKYFFDRTPETEIDIEAKTGLRDMVEYEADLVEKLIVKRLNMEYDWKRRPVRFIDSKQYNHLAFSTEPWSNVEQFVLMRDVFDRFQKGTPTCIKSSVDLQRLSEFVETTRISQSKDLRYVRKQGGDIKRLRQMLCAAFKQSQAGINLPALTNEKFAELLTANGIACDKAAVENGKRKLFVKHAVPPTDRILKLVNHLKNNVIKSLKIDDLLVPIEKDSMMIRLVDENQCKFIYRVE